ncbi:transposase [Streptomyces aureocirculatus]|uniref:transposase n=1 Tax=Streptomyces aureocirculatus TaxID=67275 RepID=UPI00099D49A1
MTPAARPPVDRRMVVEATAWRSRSEAPWRDPPERSGNWKTIFKNVDRWSKGGVWARAAAFPTAIPPRPGRSIGPGRRTDRSRDATADQALRLS